MAKKQENKRSNETKLTCPKCGTEFAIPEVQSIAVGIVIGKDSGLGEIHPPVVESEKKIPNTERERIEALRAAGVDVSNLFAMTGANGGECVACNKNGQFSVLSDDDQIYEYIKNNGTVPNRRLFRRWVMAQMFHMMNAVDWKGRKIGVTEMIHSLGYEYQWKMVENELHAQAKMVGKDEENFFDRHLWFNKNTVLHMTTDYVEKLKSYINTLPTKRCKGVPYKTVNGKHVFVDDLQKKIFYKYNYVIQKIKGSTNHQELYSIVKHFNKQRVELPWRVTKSSAWIDSFKGTGAYFTMQNLVRFHNCFIVSDEGVKLTKSSALSYLRGKAVSYSEGEGWRMLAMLKKCLEDNNINISKKMAEWRK